MLRAYIDLMSQPSRALYIFLKITNIPHVIVPIALRKGEHLSDEYSNINPFKQVPAIVDSDGFKLNESLAILPYLCTKYNVSEKLYPKDPQARSKVDAFNHWQHLNLRFGGAAIFRTLLTSKMSGNPVDENMILQGQKVLRASLGKLESIFLKDTPFIYSTHMTIADLIGVCELMQPALGVGMDLYTGYPKVEKWVSSVRSAVGEELFDDSHKWIARTADVIKGSHPTPKL